MSTPFPFSGLSERWGELRPAHRRRAARVLERKSIGEDGGSGRRHHHGRPGHERRRLRVHARKGRFIRAERPTLDFAAHHHIHGRADHADAGRYDLRPDVGFLVDAGEYLRKTPPCLFRNERRRTSTSSWSPPRPARRIISGKFQLGPGRRRGSEERRDRASSGEAREMTKVVDEHVFPFRRSLGDLGLRSRRSR